ncbi:DNA/RNA polymerase [Durotheca rogersii]|uniref:DNA/RNA polymerase n=1 Tax=Durotheca rogersii TaxID=419775 RepID=UPI00221FFF94|nr:DNA/RNA polymerase [Durotheca rogersii]KAI5864231.1 DNA/RNA polymerase [Durotheca rogersii]
MNTAALTSGRARRAPKRNEDRVILHFDYDCFYASVFENLNPSLKGLPLGVKQKSILATCNYAARARGVKKLMLVSEAQRTCPDLVLVCGEDLTPFRDASKTLWSVLRAHSWSGRVERLGLDEVFLDVTDVVVYNQELLNRNALRDSFFQLSVLDPEKGFSFDATRFCGCVYPPAYLEHDLLTLLDNPLCVRLMLASHLAGYLRHKLEELDYTSSGGISTNKVLAKLVGSVNKPRNQTTLLGLQDDDVQGFVDAHKLRQIPGIGSRTAQLVQDYVLSTSTAASATIADDDLVGQAHSTTDLTVHQVRQHPSLSAELLSRIFDHASLERGSGDKVWDLLHGIDPSAVKAASGIPAQISVEDTYMARPLNTPTEIVRELRALATSLVRRMHADLVVADSREEVDLAPPAAGESSLETRRRRWTAHPKTLRLSTRVRPPKLSGPPTAAESFARSSRSQPLPTFVLNLRDVVESVGERLAADALLPLFRRLHPERRGGWNLALINVCVTNMVVVAGGIEESGSRRTGAGEGAGGQDIARMFRTQEDKLREWTVYDTAPLSDDPTHDTTGAAKPTEVRCEEEVEGRGCGDLMEGPTTAASSPEPDACPYADVWEDEGASQRCRLCGHAIPVFAIPAHERFHAIGD